MREGMQKGLEARHFDYANFGLHSLGLFAVGKGAAQEKKELRTSANRRCFATTQSAQTGGRCKRTRGEHVTECMRDSWRIHHPINMLEASMRTIRCSDARLG